MDYMAGEPLLRPIPWPNIGEAFRCSVDRLGNSPAVYYPKYGVYRCLDWDAYGTMVAGLATSLIDRGVEVGERVAILMSNSVEWLVTDLALLSVGAVTVPLHVALSADQIAFQIEHSGARRIAVGAQEFATLRPALERCTMDRKYEIILVGSADGPLGPSVAAADRWDDVLRRGIRRIPYLRSELARRARNIGPDDPATILYTSGTTGEPKGVVLTHGNFLFNAVACCQALGQPDQPVQLNWLPYSHVFARLADHYQPLIAGTPIALARGLDRLMADLALTRPTHMSTVPRFLEKLHRTLVELPETQRRSAVRKLMGGRFVWAISGGAALSEGVARDLAEWGLLILQGYGLTETSPVISVNTPAANRPGSVGRPVPGVEVRISPEGEVLTRGPHVMQGYWRNPAATAEVIRGGWLHTGDLGYLDGDGFLWIRGRKKELLVLSTGKNVAPVAIESFLIRHPLIDQAMVTGDGRPYVAALIVPNLGELRRRLGSVAGEGVPAAELVELPQARDLLGRVVEEVNQRLARWEQIRRFALLPAPFTIESGELTPTLKLRRSVIEERYRATIGRLYE